MYLRTGTERDARIPGGRDKSIRSDRDAALANLADDLVQSISPLAAGYLALLSVETRTTDDLARWSDWPALLFPALSWRGRQHAHGLLQAYGLDDAEEAVSHYCEASGVPRGACDLSPVRGWRTLSRSPEKLRTNLFRIVRYATDETRQGAIDFGAAVALGVFSRPLARFLAAGAAALWPPLAASRPCRLMTCARLVRGRRETCSDAHRQEVSRHAERDRRPWLRRRHDEPTSQVVVTHVARSTSESLPLAPVATPRAPEWLGMPRASEWDSDADAPPSTLRVAETNDEAVNEARTKHQ